MGEGAEPLFPSFLPVFSSYLLDAEGLFLPFYMGSLGSFCRFLGGLLKVFKLFSKNFWEAYPVLTRHFSTLFKSE